MYPNFCCGSSFEPEIIKIGRSSHKMYSNNILNFQESTTILKSGNSLKASRNFRTNCVIRFLKSCDKKTIKLDDFRNNGMEKK